MTPVILHVAGLLTTALLFGGMLLFAGGFAAFLFTALPPEAARRLIRQAFPPFYVFVIMTALTAAFLVVQEDPLSAVVLATIAVTTLPTRQILMPAINQATDSGRRRRFAWLHGLSVLITLAHIATAGTVLVWLAL